MNWRILPFWLIATPFAVAADDTKGSEGPAIAPAKIPAKLGAQMEGGVTRQTLDDYTRHFDLVDLDHDGKHSKEEFIDKGNYMTTQARRGIFGAADSDGDGTVTKFEYLLNRIITDEAKEVMQAMDDDGDGAIGEAEFATHTKPKLDNDADLVRHVFTALDTNGDGETRVPEYLRLWGKWARLGRPTAEQRIASLENALKEAEKLGTETAEPGTETARADGGSPSASRRPGAGGPPSVAQVFQRLDQNQDGKLQSSEMPEFVRDRILAADSDGDGIVTVEELKKHRETVSRR